MPESIFEIDVRDAAFNRFVAAFDRYKAEVAKMPGEWGKVGKAIDSNRQQNRKLLDDAKSHRDAINRIRLSWESTTHAVEGTSRALSGVVAKAKAFGDHIGGIARTVAKWTALGGLTAGLMGAGGLWGISNLASSAGAVRRTGQGLGVYGGELQAYRTNFAKMVDPGSVLGNIASLRNDPSRMWALMSMGFDPHAKTADIATAAPLRAKQIFEEGGQNMDYARARGLLEVFTEDDLRRLHEMSVQEIQDAQRKYEADKRQFEVNDGLRRAWQALGTQLERAATAVETVFIKALSPLAPELERLSDAFTDALKTSLSLDVMRQAIAALAGGVRWLGDYLASSKFQDDLKDVGKELQNLWRAIQRVAGWINNIFGGVSPQEGQRGLDDRAAAPLGQGPEYEAEEERRRRMLRWSLLPMMRQGVDAQGRGPSDPGYDPVGGSEQRYGLPAGLLDRIWQQESRRGQRMGPSPAGALGHFQFMPQTGAQYGLQSPEDFMDLRRSADAAGRYMRDLIEHPAFRGNLRAAAAAYNYGPGNVQRLMRERGADWEQGLPRETQDYLRSVIDPLAESVRRQQPQGGTPAAPTRVDVSMSIDNPAGASVSITGARVRAQA